MPGTIIQGSRQNSLFNIQRISGPQQHHHHIRVSQEDSSRSRQIDAPASPDMQFDTRSNNHSGQFRSSSASQVQQIGEPLSNSSQSVSNDTNFSHRANYSLQSLRNNFFENYDNKLIKRQFCEDTIWTLYLISCQILCPSDAEYEPACKIAMLTRVEEYLTTVQVPMFLIMLVATYYGGCASSQAFRQRFNLSQNVDLHSDQQKAVKAVAIKYLWLCLGMSIWNIKSVAVTVDLSRACFQYSRSVVIVNFFVLTAVSGLISVILALLVICCCPMFIVSFNQLKQSFASSGIGQSIEGPQSPRVRRSAFNPSVRSRNYEFTRSLINALVHRKFSTKLNTGIDECCICMEKFHDGSDNITPLSHNTRHIFHTKCIEEWLKNNNVCPICRTEIKPEEEMQFRKKLEREQGARA